MRKSVSSAVIIFLFAIPAAVRAQESPDAAQIRALELQITTSYRERRIEALAALLDEDFVITFEDGSTLSKTGYVSFMASPSDHVEVAEMSDLKFRIHGTTGVATGIYHETGNTKGQPYDYRDRFTDIWKKKNGKWLMIAAHYSVPMK